MKLVIVHYHLRSGGIRRVIELATPHLVRELGNSIDSVVMASGEEPNPEWRAHFLGSLTGVPVEFYIEPAFGYLSEQQPDRASIRRSIRLALERLLGDGLTADYLVWAHNLGLGRNPVLASELLRHCAKRQITVLAHHHDWWFDNRWRYWPVMRQHGYATLNAVAKTVFASEPSLRHVAINRTDAKILKRHFDRQSAWLPNLAEGFEHPTPVRLKAAKRFLQESIGQKNAPVWIVPCRVLRRKNLAEALLLARWLRPEAWLVITGGPSSANEQPYAQALATAAQRLELKLRFGILENCAGPRPSVHELLAASEVVLLTSIQEGFGLTFLEAAATGRPFIARSLPNISPDLKQMGFVFPQLYGELLIDPCLFDWAAETRRQQQLFRRWVAQLPRNCRNWIGTPPVLESGPSPRPVPFSRLTFLAQLEVLAQPMELSWARCAPLNPFLNVWQERAGCGRLAPTPWPTKAAGFLSGKNYAKRFIKIVRAKPSGGLSPDVGLAAQQQFIQEKLASVHLFPLLWE